MAKEQTPEQQSRSESKERLKQIAEILKKHELVKGLTPEKLRAILEDLGPTYIKLGQIMSMRSDMIPREYCEELTRLRTAVPPMPFDEVRRVVEGSLGRAIEEVYSEFSRTPIGSASIAQAHAARLMDGSRVVVKVQREGIHDIMARDMALLRKAAGLLRIAPGAGEVVDFTMVLDEMWKVTQEELNFNIEAANAEEFYRLNEDVAFATCPRIHRELTTPQVLTMEYIDGFAVDDRQSLADNGYDLNEIGAKLADNYIKQVVTDGFFHADPHPGNIRIRGGQIVWIDMGMMGRLSARDQALFGKAVAAVAQHDVEGVKSVVLAMGRCKGKIDHGALYADIEELLTRYGGEELAGLDLGQLMAECLDVARAHHIALPEGVSMLARGLATLEGVVADLSPETNVITIATARASGLMLDALDMKKELRKGLKAILESGKKALAIPGLLSDSLRALTKGQTRLGLDMKLTEDTFKALNNLLGKAIACLLAFALLISSSIICTTDMEPKLLGIPALGTLGYLGAMVLTVWMFVRIGKDE